VSPPPHIEARESLSHCMALHLLFKVIRLEGLTTMSKYAIWHEVTQATAFTQLNAASTQCVDRWASAHLQAY
jgi:hypothetical protein